MSFQLTGSIIDLAQAILAWFSDWTSVESSPQKFGPDDQTRDGYAEVIDVGQAIEETRSRVMMDSMKSGITRPWFGNL